jgi:hypothetical protein
MARLFLWRPDHWEQPGAFGGACRSKRRPLVHRLNEGTIASYTTKDMALSTARQIAKTLGSPVIVHDEPVAAKAIDKPSLRDA